MKVLVQRKFQVLSLRVQKLTALLRDGTTVYGLFLAKGPTINGPHYRYAVMPLSILLVLYVHGRPDCHTDALPSAAVRVLDLALADQGAPIVPAARALTKWHAAVCADPREDGFHTNLQQCLEQLYGALQPFAGVGVSLNTPKIHRARDIGAVVRKFGGARITSTDTYEMAHKALKKVFLRCVDCFAPA